MVVYCGIDSVAIVPLDIRLVGVVVIVLAVEVVVVIILDVEAVVVVAIVNKSKGLLVLVAIEVIEG
jgi:hypothetical protein